jgi:hypothetical protein
MYPGQESRLSAETYAEMLAQAHTRGFSVYLAENAMKSRDWSSFGEAIRDRGIAVAPTDAAAPSPAGDADSSPRPLRIGVGY